MTQSTLNDINATLNSEPLGVTTDSAGNTWTSITTAKERNENDTPLRIYESENIETGES